jgi:UDP-glucose 4-epimerase
MRLARAHCVTEDDAEMNILLTGGTGYIGSLTCVRLIEAGDHPVLLDNLVNSKPAVLDRIEAVTGVRPPFVQGDVRDRVCLDALLARHRIDAVIHFAGLKAVGESVQFPLQYYENNVHGALVLLDALRAAGVRTFVFSSSATVYGDAQSMPISELAPTGATNPYGRTKLMVEQILEDLALAEADWSVTLLRYFNPVGGHPSGLLGEDPQGTPNNLMPYISQVAVGLREHLTVFGNDYPTADGTGVRDYIHVLDLADGHVAALRQRHGQTGARIYNLGTGRGYSVLEAVRAFEQASGRRVPFVVAPRRPGDVASCWADPARAQRELGWRAQRSIDEMCRDAWAWQQTNPTGYPT